MITITIDLDNVGNTLTLSAEQARKLYDELDDFLYPMEQPETTTTACCKCPHYYPYGYPVVTVGSADAYGNITERTDYSIKIT